MVEEAIPEALVEVGRIKLENHQYRSGIPQHVKTELAGVTMGLAPLVEKENTISQLLPIYMQLLKDSTAEVRLNIITNLHKVNDVIGASQLLNWRFICEYGAMHRNRDGSTPVMERKSMPRFGSEERGCWWIGLCGVGRREFDNEILN
ncbi:unnamed protein product [Cylicocyclus nassatus]|uniref:Uncharacterized protein n=1 Tax=Cylicocyclus nassatus TaxID=53992 RepID=A0AA36LZZ4_CYLNA|nr:unnamed protein product [Cylicocyclus nassatus]